MADDIVREFLAESNENLDTLDRELVLLEKDPKNNNILGSVFRSIHTIKGTCGFLGFTKLEKVAHSGENLLSNMRDGKLVLNTEIASGLLSMVDAVRRMLTAIEATGQDGETDYRDLIASLTLLQQPALDTESKAGTAASEPGVGSSASADEEDADQPLVGETAVRKTEGTGTPIARESEIPEKALRAPAVGADDVLAAPPPMDGAKAREAGTGTIRVEVGLLDRLMNLVGELVLARNQALQYTNTNKGSSFRTTSQRLNIITTELQESVMKTRMQPIGNIWSQFPRTVRDVALSCGKQVRIEMEGKETELDKTIIEAIKDPLTHLVRNAVDHGIEAPAVRLAAGKPAEGRVSLRAFHEGGQVNIEISDDGGGLHHDRIRRKAVERGLIPAEQAARLSDREAVNLIFAPGFSTAEKITNVSGRGVGMDVVKTNIEKIGGTVDVHSKARVGTTVKMKIPLTLAIIPALVVKTGGDRYAIPQVSLLELVRLEGDEARSGIESVHGAPVHRLRGRLLPLVFLNRELQVADGDKGARTDEAINIVVVQADGHPFGLVVEEVIDTEEIVVKPLGKQFKSANTYAGATIMGDGKVALILDMLGLAQRASVIGETRDTGGKDHAGAGASAVGEAAQAKQTLLLLEISGGGRAAIPLSLVARLEEFPQKSIEQVGYETVVQYRGDILPLLDVTALLEERRQRSQPSGSMAKAEGERLQVVVTRVNKQQVGLVVDRILDVVESTAAIDAKGCRAGVTCKAVIQSRVTEVLDVDTLVHMGDRVLQHELEPELVEA
jgi:two-component system, chemotaxis family, sensor kinase CheA